MAQTFTTVIPMGRYMNPGAFGVEFDSGNATTEPVGSRSEVVLDSANDTSLVLATAFVVLLLLVVLVVGYFYQRYHRPR